MNEWRHGDSTAVGRLHVITDYRFQQRFSHPRLAAMACAGGAHTVQFRQKHGGVRHLLAEARSAAWVCKSAGVTFVVNDRLDVAIAVDADGVHVGQHDLPVVDARRVLGPDAIVGATATTLAQARRAQDEGASYIGFGPVYATASKANLATVKGLDALARVSGLLEIPVIAIGGITLGRINDVMATGAHGVAVMTAVTLAPDPEIATREIADLLRASR